MTSREELKLFVERGRTRIKVEVNHVFRGTLLPVISRPLAEQAQDFFFSDVEIPILHPDELYGGKLVAAMDRQHPRDLFDVLMLYENGGLTDGIIDCFVGYLAGHNRPIHEVLFANEIPIESAFHNEFRGMTREPVDLGMLLETRRCLLADVPARLSRSRKVFLLGLVGGGPDWSLMPFDHLSDMPAIRWKLANLERLRESNPGKFAFQTAELRARLGV